MHTRTTHGSYEPLLHSKENVAKPFRVQIKCGTQEAQQCCSCRLVTTIATLSSAPLHVMHLAVGEGSRSIPQLPVAKDKLGANLGDTAPSGGTENNMLDRGHRGRVHPDEMEGHWGSLVSDLETMTISLKFCNTVSSLTAS